MRRAYEQVLSREPDLELCGATATAEELLAVKDTVRFDLLVTDYSLPGIDGISLVRILTKDRPTLPAIVISAHDGTDTSDRSLNAGAAAFLSKRDITSDLIPTIRRLCQHSDRETSTQT